VLGEPVAGKSALAGPRERSHFLAMGSRRQFLLTLAGAALGVAARPRSGGAALAAKPRPRVPIGLQLYTVRALMERDFEGTLAQVAAIGCREVEFAGYFGRSPTQVREVLRQHGLAAPSTHIALPASDDAWARALDDAVTIGHRWVVIPWLDPAIRRTPDDWSRIAERLAALGGRARQAGLRLAYHNHDFELARGPDGRTHFERLLATTEPARVDFEMDVYWVSKAGADPLAYLRRFRGRFPLLHLKDATAAPERRMTDVGRGTIDFARILAAAQRDGLRHAFIEHDEAPDPLASAQASYRYLSALRY
jgi:sugar phosphate isomerase/epimerase